MAVRIQSYEQQTNTPGAAGQPQMQATPVVDGMGQALGNIAGAATHAVGSYQNSLQRQEEEDAKSWVGKTVSDAHVEWEQNIQQREEAARPGAPNFTPDVLKSYDEWSEKAIEKAPTKTAKQYLSQHLTSYRTQLANQAINFEGQAKLNYRAEQFSGAADNWSKVVAGNPAKFDLAMSSLNETLPDVGPMQQEKLKSAAKETLIRSAVSGAINANPAGTSALLSKGLKEGGAGVGWVDAMAAPEILHYKSVADSEANRRMAVAREGMADKERDLQAMAVNGVVPPPGFTPTRAEYVAAYGQDGEQRYQQNVADVTQLAVTVNTFARQSPQERSAALLAIAPKPGDGYAREQQVFNIAQQASAVVDKQLRDDPAAFILKNSPAVAQATAVLQAAFQGDDDAAKRSAIDSYSQVMLAEQKRLGAPEPKILPEAQANQIVAQFFDQKEGGQNAAQLMLGLEQQWGASWPDVFKQLSTGNKLPPAALVIPSMSDDGARERLARVSLVEDKVLETRMQSGQKKQLQDRVQKTLEPFWNTLAVQNGGETTYQVFQSQTLKLAMLYASTGKSTKDAVKQAVHETVDHAYQFENTYRIPKKEMPDEVIRGVRSTISQMPGEFDRSTVVPVTDGDEKGVVLYGQFPSGLRPLVSPEGQPYHYTWQQLRDSNAKPAWPAMPDSWGRK